MKKKKLISCRGGRVDMKKKIAKSNCKVVPQRSIKVPPLLKKRENKLFWGSKIIGELSNLDRVIFNRCQMNV